MKILFFILFNLFLLFSDAEKSKEVKYYNSKISMDAVMAQDVPSFFSANPQSQKRNQVEFWEDDIFVPKLKTE
ncbi:MAG: hypothetical protein V1779_09920 [bacterium]